VKLSNKAAKRRAGFSEGFTGFTFSEVKYKLASNFHTVLTVKVEIHSGPAYFLIQGVNLLDLNEIPKNDYSYKSPLIVNKAKFTNLIGYASRMAVVNISKIKMRKTSSLTRSSPKQLQFFDLQNL